MSIDLDALGEAQKWLDEHPHFHSARKSDVKALIAELRRARECIEAAMSAEERTHQLLAGNAPTWQDSSAVWRILATYQEGEHA